MHKYLNLSCCCAAVMALCVCLLCFTGILFLLCNILLFLLPVLAGAAGDGGAEGDSGAGIAAPGAPSKSAVACHSLWLRL